MHSIPDILAGVTRLFDSRNDKSLFLARQIMFSLAKPSAFIEKYLYNNEGDPQNLAAFPMMRDIYDALPQELLLKCSRKTLKSTLLSNIICLNMLRWNYYHMLYVSPQESTTKYFSSNYVGPRFTSPELKKIFVKGWEKNDVYEKIFADTSSSILFKYAKEDATRCRGPATDHNLYDEVQDMYFDEIPIISETMAMSPYKREYFAGTPLTTDNTINRLWLRSTQYEWATKCTSCNHWNMLTFDNNPIKMIRPEGFCCSACGTILDTSTGCWVSSTTETQKKSLVGYHLAQPIIPHYNSKIKEWTKVYNKVTDGKYGPHQIYNEVFGLAYDVGTKPITKEELASLCTLGPIKDPGSNNLNILIKNKRNYIKTSTGVDWGVNMITSRTAVVHGAVRNDGIYEVFDSKIFKTQEHLDHIKEIAGVSNSVNSIIAADGGPDPWRAQTLGEMTSPKRMLIVRYGAGKLVQYFDMPAGATSWKQNRYVLHRSDCLSFTFRMLKAGKVLFPQLSDMQECFEDILAETIEARDTGLVQELKYDHAENRPDDYLHALTFALVSAYSALGDKMLIGPSSTAVELTTTD